MHDKLCICQNCLNERRITSICRHRAPEDKCPACLLGHDRACQCKMCAPDLWCLLHPSRMRNSCVECYNEAISAKVKQGFNRPRKTITRINLTEAYEQVVIYTDRNSGLTQHWSNPNDQIVIKENRKTQNCYLDRVDATETFVNGGVQRKLATIHTCKDHMVVVDWTA